MAIEVIRRDEWCADACQRIINTWLRQAKPSTLLLVDETDKNGVFIDRNESGGLDVNLTFNRQSNELILGVIKKHGLTLVESSTINKGLGKLEFQSYVINVGTDAYAQIADLVLASTASNLEVDYIENDTGSRRFAVNVRFELSKWLRSFLRRFGE